MALALLALTMAAGSPAAGAAERLTVSEPWLRFIIPARPAAGYFTLSNASDTAVALVGAASPGCGQLMLHQSRSRNGVDQMVHVARVTVPAHGSVSFAPGGYHLMCMTPTPMVAIGKSVPVTLSFADGAKVTTDFPVKGPGGR